MKLPFSCKKPALLAQTTLAMSAGLLSAAVSAQNIAERVQIELAATPKGAHAVVIEHDSSLASHTIYRPATLTGNHPVMVWGEGACAKAGLMFPEFQAEIASHGVVVIADGPPVRFNRETGRPEGAPAPAADAPARVPGAMGDPAPLIQALDWIFAGNRDQNSPYYQQIDTTRVAAMGMSCGGLMAYAATVADPRIKVTGIWNSGLFTGKDDVLPKLRGPVILITGGESDIAYPNARSDYEQMPDHVRLFYAVHPETGHYGTYTQPNGGEYGELGVAWIRWHLLDDHSAAGKGMFVGSDCVACNNDSWQVLKKNMP